MKPENYELVVKKIEEIPTLPIISQKILDLLGDEEVPLKKIAEVIEKDMALAVKILKVANSPFYGTLSKVSSIDHALALLGLDEIKAILLAFSVHKFFSAKNNAGIDRRRFWRHSIICSQIARHLALQYKIDAGDSLFLAGLIHDIGKIVFDQYFHEDFKKIVAAVSSEKKRFSIVEKEMLGVTHYQIAAKVLQQWRFPQKVIYHVFYHHAPWHDKLYPTGSAIIYLANIFTKLAGYPSLATEQKMDIEQLANSNAILTIRKNGIDLDAGKIRHMVRQIQEFIASEGYSILSFLE